MRKYIILVLSLLIIALPFYVIWEMNRPKAGPIGNGPPETPFLLIVSIVLMGLSFLVYSILMFIKKIE
ncbi:MULTISPECIES: hypothetical protein [Bacillus]|uniref:hypothetical protein n=1 Tax=Bacillus TaxID=1386 RepID=UPI000BB8D718|nr:MULTISPECIES: hypothetical protein [Bacillus]